MYSTESTRYDEWVTVQSFDGPRSDSHHESITSRVQRVRLDLEELLKFYNTSVSPRRHQRLKQFYSDELNSLLRVDFQDLSQHDRIDFLLLRNFLRRRSRQLELERQAHDAAMPLLPFAPVVVALCESRQDVELLQADKFAEKLEEIRSKIQDVTSRIDKGKIQVSKTTAYKAGRIVDHLREHLAESCRFYATYHPMFDWWASKPRKEADAAMISYSGLVRSRLAGMGPDDESEIIGDPIGRRGLLVELEAEMIPYTPEGLISLAMEQYQWCEAQMKAASGELGFGEDWKKALEHVKTLCVPPGEQTQLVKQLAHEGASFVRKHNLVTVPDVAEETTRMFMMDAERQKESPFFLGGPSIIVSYPTVDMPHNLKKMVMRGNNRHFSRATAFHELIPGHRLQLYVGERHNSHRTLFDTPFFVEGWAMYWEMVFWARGDFFVSPEDRIGTLFWRMHRCARIVFSLKFHLGKMTPRECVDLLVDWVGHERANAEGEVRRSFGGDYRPLYQAGYMLGALQLFRLREEVLGSGTLGEKEFHDCVLKANTMPIELLRALLLDKELSPDYKAKWCFY